VAEEGFNSVDFLNDAKTRGLASAKAIIKGTEADSQVSGMVDIVEIVGGGIQVIGEVSNVKPDGLHGIHIHEKGDCGDGGKAAGSHFNPKLTKHGYLPKDGVEQSHAGDMGNIAIDADGKGSLIVFLSGLSLTKEDLNVAGKAIILHSKEDDFSDPAGNAGERIGCGVIELNIGLSRFKSKRL
jgi:Cu-Zn family superoxide dismutase